jgi:hypothetical protein
MAVIFKAKWSGVCGVCGISYNKNEFLHYVNNKVAHEFCHSPDGSDFERQVSGHGYYRSEEYRVKGKRNHEKPCASCGLTHAGECW